MTVIDADAVRRLVNCDHNTPTADSMLFNIGQAPRKLDCGGGADGQAIEAKQASVSVVKPHGAFHNRTRFERGLSMAVSVCNRPRRALIFLSP